jgi:hypothetical protein
MHATTHESKSSSGIFKDATPISRAPISNLTTIPQRNLSIDHSLFEGGKKNLLVQQAPLFKYNFESQTVVLLVSAITNFPQKER